MSLWYFAETGEFRETRARTTEAHGIKNIFFVAVFFSFFFFSRFVSEQTETRTTKKMEEKKRKK